MKQQAVGKALVLACTCVMSLGIVSATGKERIRIVQDSCSIETLTEGGERHLMVICEEVSFRGVYLVGDPSPSIVTGIDGGGNRFIELRTPPDHNWPDGEEQCFEDMGMAWIDDGVNEPYYDCITVSGSICVQIPMSSSGSGTGTMTLEGC